VTRADLACRYATIGAILMSKKVVDGVRDKGGFWKHGHTYQVRFSFPECPLRFPQVDSRHTRSLALRLWPFKKLSRQIDC
jgi:hypothetical protein